MNFMEIWIISLFILYSVESFKLLPHTPEWYAKFQEFLEAPVREETVENIPVEKNKVAFFLFSKNNRPYPINLTEENLHNIGINADKLFVLIHGWCEGRHIQWYEDLKNALLDCYHTSYVIEVDWSDPAFDFYPNSVAATKNVGKIVGDFLITIHNKRKVSTKNMIILGHSLGGHVAGFTGKTVENVLPKLARIVGMDPAGPLFDNKTCERRLCKTDADVVQALHTDAGGMGYTDVIGTIDFYANGGYQQNGCENSSEEDCDHTRSFMYIIEAVRNPTHFVSKRCANWRIYQQHQQQCDKVKVTLGDFQNKERGTFYFATHKKPPFALESEKAKSHGGHRFSF
ncbi:hypothetical protein WA026_006585 [Henosepilachna vigintioctopunctata]|uniref:Lipase domain-containing protein n=1 Tax=Henosepilachna vigintioctopunctata TaxID=420089 RepID=A0AAW1UFE3_9CUCU